MVNDEVRLSSYFPYLNVPIEIKKIIEKRQDSHAFLNISQLKRIKRESDITFQCLLQGEVSHLPRKRLEQFFKSQHPSRSKVITPGNKDGRRKHVPMSQLL